MGYGPLIKYGLIVAAFLAVCVGLIAYGSHRKQIEWDAAIAVQAVAAAESVIQAAENTVRVEKEFAKTLAEHDAAVQIVEREVKVYVQGKSKKCPVSAELERTIDTVSGMLNSSKDRVSAAARPTGAAAEPSEASTPAAEIVPAIPVEPLTDVVVLRAYEHSVTELDALWTVYAALVDWTRTSYALQVEAAGR